ncbi:MAG: phage major capsid protein [Acidobacteriota bacterium]
MTHLSNRTILEKADLALADLTAGGGLLKPAQAQKFMRLLIKESVLMKLATVVPMASPKQQISKIKFSSRILRPGQEATALGATERVKPDLSQIELDAKLFKAEVRLSDEVLEDSIERGELRRRSRTDPEQFRMGGRRRCWRARGGGRQPPPRSPAPSSPSSQSGIGTLVQDLDRPGGLGQL